MIITNISSTNDPILLYFKSLKNNKLSENQFIADSEKVVLKLLRSKFKTKVILGTDDFIKKNETILSQTHAKLYSAPKKIMEYIVGYRLHHGVMAIGEGETFLPLSFQDTIISLNGITSPENVGAIIRNISGFGFKSVLVDTKTCSPFTRRAIRVSMGNIFDLRTSQTSQFANTLIKLKNNGYTIIGTANIESATSLKEFEACPKTVLIIGSEGFGIDKDILSICDQVIKIPIKNSVGHLNAACASSIFLYELNNQLSI